MSIEAKIARGILRPNEKLCLFFFFVNKRSRHEFHSCLGTTSYNTYPLPSLSTFTTQSFSVWRQGQLKRLRFKLANIGTFYPAILSVFDTLKSILKKSPSQPDKSKHSGTVQLLLSHCFALLHLGRTPLSKTGPAKPT